MSFANLFSTGASASGAPSSATLPNCDVDSLSTLVALAHAPTASPDVIVRAMYEVNAAIITITTEYQRATAPIRKSVTSQLMTPEALDALEDLPRLPGERKVEYDVRKQSAEKAFAAEVEKKVEEAILAVLPAREHLLSHYLSLQADLHALCEDRTFTLERNFLTFEVDPMNDLDMTITWKARSTDPAVPLNVGGKVALNTAQHDRLLTAMGLAASLAPNAAAPLELIVRWGLLPGLDMGTMRVELRELSVVCPPQAIVYNGVKETTAARVLHRVDEPSILWEFDAPLRAQPRPYVKPEDRVVQNGEGESDEDVAGDTNKKGLAFQKEKFAAAWFREADAAYHNWTVSKPRAILAFPVTGVLWCNRTLAFALHKHWRKAIGSGRIYDPVTMKKINNKSQLTSPWTTFLQKILPVLLAVGGMWYATQSVAYQLPVYEVRDEMGRIIAPSFGYLFTAWGIDIYTPLNIFLWWLGLYKDWLNPPGPVVDAIFNYAYLVASICVGLGMVLFIIMSYWLRAVKQKLQYLQGTARLADKTDLLDHGLLQCEDNKCSIVLAQLKEDSELYVTNSGDGGLKFQLDRPGTLVGYEGKVHGGIFAYTRSGKGVGSILPTNFDWPYSMICFDPKGENYKLAGGFRSKLGPVINLDPTDRQGARYNPVLEIRRSVDGIRDAQLMADVFVKTNKANDPHWENNGAYLVSGCLLHLVACDQEEVKSLSGLYRLLARFKSGVQAANAEKGVDMDPEKEAAIACSNFLKFMRDSVHAPEIENNYIHEYIVDVASKFLQTPDKERGSIFSTALTALLVYSDPILAETTSTSDFFFDDFYNTSKPITLYLSVPTAHVQRLAPFFKFMIEYFIKRITEGGTSHGQAKLKIPLLFLIDEFPLLGKLEFITGTLGIIAGYNATFLLVSQTYKQILELYGKDTPILSHLSVKMFYAPQDDEEQQMLEKLIGKESYLLEKTSESIDKKKLGSQSASINYEENTRSILNADELKNLPLAQCLIVKHGMPVYIGHKNCYFQDPRYEKRIGWPVPQLRADVVESLKNIPSQRAGNEKGNRPGDANGWYSTSISARQATEHVLAQDPVSAVNFSPL